MFPKTETFRVYVFKDLATANASTQKFGNGTFLRVKGEHSRFKFAAGQTFSAQTPSRASSLKFSQLPWISTVPNAGNAYAANATATLTAAQLIQRYITSTSAAATSLTLPTAAAIVAVNGYGRGDELDFTVDNSAGASAVTLVVNTGIAVAAVALTGADSLVVAAGQFGKFKIIFKSGTAALLYRVL